MAKNKTPHTTLIPTAARVARILRRAGLVPYPGPIDPKGGKGGTYRIKVTHDPGRIRIRVAAGGVQELYLYGPIDLAHLVNLLTTQLGAQAIEHVDQLPTLHAPAADARAKNG
ncbi:MAG: hypothetical protein H7833_15830 [Magnetococcus sp. DMHC-1]|nr:hypothetical protein [Magnetococcales bacterium]